ncbi:MAG TPA: protein-S-isoprenylcysteine O-methyltransferase [Salinarimonas sp.]|jgi:protein-S-isoprenylcysteine O-methyltransferase Ste14|nr:protein-S-isoprenylcysteine O-methyltransferase [Salinarimonas sp.]
MTPDIAKLAWGLGALAWCLLRFPFERSANRVPVARSERSVREGVLLAAAMIGFGVVPFVYAVFGGFPETDYRFRPGLAYAGIGVFLASLWLFYRTHRDLGANWSISLEVRERHALVTHGVYARVRHPMYAAFWLWAVAQALLLPNWIAGPAGLVGFAILFLGRVEREERLMIEAFGDAYRAYMARSWRLIPGLY